MKQILILNARYNEKLAEISNLNLADWLELAASLKVANNDREHAAKKLAIRELKAEGVL